MRNAEFGIRNAEGEISGAPCAGVPRSARSKFWGFAGLFCLKVIYCKRKEQEISLALFCFIVPAEALGLKIIVGQILLCIIYHFVKELSCIGKRAGNERVGCKHLKDSIKVAICDSVGECLLLGANL